MLCNLSVMMLPHCHTCSFDISVWMVDFLAPPESRPCHSFILLFEFTRLISEAAIHGNMMKWLVWYESFKVVRQNPTNQTSHIPCVFKFGGFKSQGTFWWPSWSMNPLRCTDRTCLPSLGRARCGRIILLKKHVVANWFNNSYPPVN